MRTITQDNAEAITSKLESEGFDYYMEEYGAGDLEGTICEPFFRDWQQSKRALVEALSEVGVDLQ